jgi:hypothetical protein
MRDPHRCLVPERAGRFVFCGTVRQDASRHRFPRVSRSRCFRLRGIAPFGVRTFLLPQAVSGKAILRLSKIEDKISLGRTDLKPLMVRQTELSLER